METNTQLAKPENAIKTLLSRDDVKSKFAEIIGKKANGFLVSVMNAISSNELLKNADPNSILNAAAIAATLDLPINQNLGFAYLIPYNAKQPDGSYRQVCQFQIGYKGIIQLAQRSGQFETINATDVREGEIQKHDRLTGEITFKWHEDNRDQHKIVGFVAYFKLLNGFNKSFYLTVEELKNHGLRYSQTFKSERTRKYSKWETDFDAMAQKTVIKLLLSKYAPLTIEMQKAVIADQSEIKNFEGTDVEYVDHNATVVDVDLQSERKEYERITEFIGLAKNPEDLEKLREHLKDDFHFQLFENKEKELKNKK